MEYSLNLQIWDVLGQKSYSAVQSRALVGMDGALIVSDITRKETLANLSKYWLPTIEKVVVDPQLVFLVNKSDLKDESQFSLDDMRDISSEYGLSDIDNTYLTSAKTGENVENAFLAIAKMMLIALRPEDPTREIFEELMADSVLMDKDKSVLIDVTDAIITEFINEYYDKEEGMAILREQFVRAGIEVSKPTKPGLLRVIEYLIEQKTKQMTVSSRHSKAQEIKAQKDKWTRMVNEAKDAE
jgi:GTPase SAR1 family protein